MKSNVALGVQNKSAQSTKVFGAKLHGRSRITNGSDLLPSVDGRSVWARRLRDLISLHVNDYGGSSAISEAERSLVRRAAALTVELELLEVKFASNGGAQMEELDKYQRAANSLRRLLESLGLQRRSRDVTPNLHDYLDRKANEVSA
jgi:hypothetical protein